MRYCERAGRPHYFICPVGCPTLYLFSVTQYITANQKIYTLEDSVHTFKIAYANILKQM